MYGAEEKRFPEQPRRDEPRPGDRMGRVLGVPSSHDSNADDPHADAFARHRGPLDVRRHEEIGITSKTLRPHRICEGAYIAARRGELSADIGRPRGDLERAVPRIAVDHPNDRSGGIGDEVLAPPRAPTQPHPGPARPAPVRPPIKATTPRGVGTP